MSEKKTREKQQSPFKLALAVGLTVVFIVVVVIQVKTYSGDASAGTREAVADAGLQGKRKDEATISLGETPGKERRIAEWPAVDIEECVEYDPFALPAEFEPKQQRQSEKGDAEAARQRELELARKQAVREEAISRLKEAGVRAIFQGPDGRTALVGEDTIRVGQEIQGHRVVAIDTRGIVLEPITD